MESQRQSQQNTNVPTHLPLQCSVDTFTTLTRSTGTEATVTPRAVYSTFQRVNGMLIMSNTFSWRLAIGKFEIDDARVFINILVSSGGRRASRNTNLPKIVLRCVIML